MAAEQPASIAASPAAGQRVSHEGQTFTTVREGQAYILVPPNARTSIDPKSKAKAESGAEQAQNVFYNPIQQFNRDLSVLAIKAFGEDLCERKRRRHERDSQKTLAKKERKRKRKAAQEGGEDEDGGGKWCKTEHGSAVPAADNATETTQDEIKTGNGTAADGETTVSRPENGTFEGEQKRHDANGSGANDTTGDNTNMPQPQQPWTPQFRILDALSATGLRALRYASEIPFATSITANDMDRGATKSIRTNVEHGKLASTIAVNTGNAIGHMYSVAYPPEDSHGPHHVSAKYDAIDLDPYGTAAPFIDAALQALNDGGLLCVTCTDSGVFASCGYSEKTYSLYGGMPVKGPHSHEGGLRLILNSIASSAAKYGMAIEPLLSLSIDFYVRMFIRVTKSPADVKFLSGKTMLAYDCDAGCGAWSLQMLGRNVRQTGKAPVKGQEKNPTFNFKHSITQGPSTDRFCEHCNSKMHVAGPMWAGPIHNMAFVEKVLADAQAADSEIYQTKPRIEGMLDTALNELVVIPEAEDVWRTAEREHGTPEHLPKTPPETVDPHPFFFIPSALSKVIHCSAPPEAAIKGALRHAGYRATRSHCRPGSIKTDAPWIAIWEIMREWVRQKAPIKEGALKEGLAGWHIMQRARKPEEEINGRTNKEDSEGSSSPTLVTERKETPVSAPPTDPKRMEVVFDEVLGRDKPGKRLVRYQQNPRENWGPMARAKGSE